MAQQHYRANLSAAVFPMTVAKAGRSVIIPGPDQNFDRRIDSPGDTPRGSVGIPQVIYAENVLPTPDGMQSVAFITKTPINLTGMQIATAVVPVRIATTEVTTTTTETTAATTLFTDAGADISSWIRTPDVYFSNGDEQYSIAWEQDASAGNPAPSYRFISFSYNVSQPELPYSLYRQIAIGDPNNLAFEFDFFFTTIREKSFMMGVGNSIAGAGLKVYINNQTGLETMKIGTAGDWADYVGFTEYVSVPLTGTLLPNVWMRLEVTAVRTIGDTRTITATIKDAGGATLFTTSTVETFVPENYFGFGTISQYATNSQIYLDNFEISGDALSATTTTTVTELTGIATVYIAFADDDTAKWSYDLDAWGDNAVTVPGGFASPLSPAGVSTAIVRGITYLCIRVGAVTKIYTLTVDTGTEIITFVDVSTTIGSAMPNPYNINSVVSICGSYNYLILATAAIILWSSTTTPTDFAPSLVSGAGNEVPGNLKGDITFIREHIAGFFIYTTSNAVFAAYTGNARYPWKFREVGASGGYSYNTQISGDTNSAVQYGVNNTKLIQVLGPDNAELVAPEVTDFIERSKKWDIFDSVDDVFTLSDPVDTTLIPEDKPTIWFLLDRYLLLPYGTTAPDSLWTYVIVYDSLLKRYGKLKITFDFCIADDKSMYFINRITGAVKKLTFDINATESGGEGDPVTHEGVLVLGKFKYVRSRFLTLEEIALDSLQSTEVIPLVDRTFSVSVLPTLDGKTFLDPVIPFDNTAVTTLDAYEGLCQVSCDNFALVVKGAFDLNTVALIFHVDGDD